MTMSVRMRFLARRLIVVVEGDASTVRPCGGRAGDQNQQTGYDANKALHANRWQFALCCVEFQETPTRRVATLSPEFRPLIEERSEPT